MTIAAAVAILTRIPVASAGAAASSGAAAFGLVGGLVAATGAVPILVLGGAEPMLAAILAIVVMAIVSGGLHLDGLADTTDALLAPDPGLAERARKDPAIGVGGAIALILVIAAQVAALASLTTRPGPLSAALTLIAAGAASRALGVVVVRTWRSRAPADGFGSWFAGRVSSRAVVVAAGTAASVAIGAGAILGAPLLAVGVALGTLAGLGMAAAIIRVRGQLDGDAMGAAIELTAAAILVAVAVLPDRLA